MFILKGYFGFFLLFVAVCPGIALEIDRFQELNPGYHVEWRADLKLKNITFVITAKTLGYVGFGLSPNGRGMQNADIVIGGVKNGEPYFGDYHAQGNSKPEFDKNQDWVLLSASENSTHTTLRVTRIFNTCDNEDVVINQDDTTKLIWAIGTTDDVTYHNTQRGIASVMLLDPLTCDWNATAYEIWQISVKTKLPLQNTTYWCTIHKSPPYPAKRHMIGFNVKLESSESRRHTHHLILHHCIADSAELIDSYEHILKTDGGECYNGYMFGIKQTCEQFTYGWAIGAGPLYLPEDIGVPLNEHGLQEYFLLEVHYDNPNELPDLTYPTGIEVYTTNNLRYHEAGILTVGHDTRFTLMIPPNTSEYIISGHCDSTCTTERIPVGGITIFNVFLHSHLAGRKMKLRQFRDGLELPWLSNDNNYDFNYQQNRLLPEFRQVLRGDHLTYECTDDSTNRSPPGAILGGLGTSQEMCLSFLMYYPRVTTLNFCGSYFGNIAALLEKLGIEDIDHVNYYWDPLVKGPPKYANKFYSDVLSNWVMWNETLKMELQNLTRFGEHIGICNPGNAKPIISYPKVKTYQPNDPCSKCVSWVMESAARLIITNLFVAFATVYCNINSVRLG